MLDLLGLTILRFMKNSTFMLDWFSTIIAFTNEMIIVAHKVQTVG